MVLLSSITITLTPAMPDPYSAKTLSRFTRGDSPCADCLQ
jgi:hypothetical protein